MAQTVTGSEKVHPPARLRLCQLRRSERNHELTVWMAPVTVSPQLHPTLIQPGRYHVLRAHGSKWGAGPAIGELVGKADSQVPHPKLHCNRMGRGSPGTEGQGSTGPGSFPSHSCSLRPGLILPTGGAGCGAPQGRRVWFGSKAALSLSPFLTIYSEFQITL